MEGVREGGMKARTIVLAGDQRSRGGQLGVIHARNSL